MILTNKKSLYNKIVRLKSLSHSKKRRFIHDAIGYNYQMTNLQAAIGLASLAHVEESIRKKQIITKMYAHGFQKIPGIIVPKTQPWATNVHWMYAIRIDKKLFGLSRDIVMKKLAEQNIQTRTFFFSPKTAFKKLNLFQKKSFPVAEMAEREGLYLPSGLGTTAKEIKTVIKTLRSLHKAHI